MWPPSLMFSKTVHYWESKMQKQDTTYCHHLSFSSGNANFEEAIISWSLASVPINITSLSSSDNDHVLVDYRKAALKHTLHVKSRFHKMERLLSVSASHQMPASHHVGSFLWLSWRVWVGMGCVKNERQLKTWPSNSSTNSSKETEISTRKRNRSWNARDPSYLNCVKKQVINQHRDNDTNLAQLSNKATAAQAKTSHRDTLRTLSASVCLYLQQQVGTQQKGEDQFVFGQQRASHIVIQLEGEVVAQIAKASFQDLGLITESTAPW